MLPTCDCPDSPVARRRQVVNEGRPVGTVYYKCARAGNERGNDGCGLFMWDEAWEVIQCAEQERKGQERQRQHDEPAAAKAEPSPKEESKVDATAKEAAAGGLEAVVAGLMAAVDNLALQVGALAELVAVAHA
ncbi:hypothetical protein N2152v2_002865 [Parachlorella kessleri]